MWDRYFRTRYRKSKKQISQVEIFCIRRNKRVSETVKGLRIRPLILFARDVFIHQSNPFAFLEDIVSIPSELVILRICTRYKGATMLDSENSCEWHYGRWVPNMVMNSDEVIKSIRAKVPVESLYVTKKLHTIRWACRAISAKIAVTLKQIHQKLLFV